MSCPDCRIVEYLNPSFMGMTEKPARLIQCPLHAHAKELLEALKAEHREYAELRSHKNEVCEACALIKKCEEK